jgi:hypothetical protein
VEKIRDMSDPSYRTVPPLAAYIERIGAEELNFRRFMVKEHRGEYYVERSLIIVNADGTISCSNKDHAPTKDEAEAIKAALHSSKFPRSVGATGRQVKELRGSGQLRAGSISYEFVDREGRIVMIQERATIKGKKIFIPWSYWSDGHWRKMEPEGALPFWRPYQERRESAVMIHEGAKAAKAVTDLIADPELLKKHPWGETLALYEHWGIVGGALAPHRADYASLIREKFSEVVYVCDNDFPGKSALQEVSRNYSGAMKGIMFDGRWPVAWDMADQMPKALFAAGGRYIGPPLSELMQHATRATELIQGDRGRPLAKAKSAFVEEWFHSVTPEVFIHRDWPNRIYTLPEFNSVVRPFSDVDDTARLVKADAASKSAVLKYSPAVRPGIYGGEGGRFINTHCPSGIKPEAGDPQPFLEYVDHLVPGEADRLELLRWCATLIARPQIRMLYGVLMISEMQGVGKGTLGEKILAPLVGEANVSYPSEKEIVDSNFNYWLAHKRLAVVHEIYAGHSSKAYNTLKSIVTDRYITVSRKFQANYEIENWMHVFACSNSMRAIQLTMDDRRWFVPKVTEKKKPPKYWTDLNRWLTEEAGLRIIRHWADDWLTKNEAVQGGSSAPWSELKKEIVEEGYSNGQILVARTLDRFRSAIDGEDPDLREKLERAGHLRDDQMIVLDEDFVELIKTVIYDGRHNDRIERPLTIRKIAKARGWHVGDLRVKVPSIRAQGSRMICSTPDLAKMIPSEIFGARANGEEKLLPVDLTAFRGL